MLDLEKIKSDYPEIDFNEERIKILEEIESGHRCFLNIIGKAGCGKSVTLNFLKRYLDDKGKNIIVCATTGVASALLNTENPDCKSTTLHSTFLIRPQNIQGNFDPSNIRTSVERREQLEKVIENADFIFIDESSMLTSDIFNYLIEELLYFRHGTLPSIILFGDIFQLPPVVKMNDKDIKDYYKNYLDSKIFFYNAPRFKDLKFKTIELSKVYRQKDDMEFTEILNRIRVGKQTQSDIDKINTRCVSENKQIDWDLDNEDSVRLCPTNNECNTYNQIFLDAVDSPLVSIPSDIKGNFLYTDEFKSGLYPEELKLKVGAKVMITRNAPSDEESGYRAYVNGDVGIVTSINDEFVGVQLKDKEVCVKAEKVSHEEYCVEKNDDRISVDTHETGSWTNFPLKISYAITIHKSQGTTLDKGVIDLGHWVAESGVYVARSRFRHLNDFILTRPIKMSDIKVCKESKEFLDTLDKVN